jgi:addiction module HigA family antidote
MLLNSFHPSEFLRELMDEYRISAYRLAKDNFIPQSRVGEILKGKRGITPDTALRLARYFGTTPQYWLNLQTSYDLGHCHADHLDEINSVAFVSAINTQSLNSSVVPK